MGQEVLGEVPNNVLIPDNEWTMLTALNQRESWNAGMSLGQGVECFPVSVRGCRTWSTDPVVSHQNIRRLEGSGEVGCISSLRVVMNEIR